MKKSFVFSIDPSSSKTLMIRIEEVQGEGKEMKWTGGNRKLYKDTLYSLASGKEVHVLELLIKEKSRHLRGIGRRESEDTMDLGEIPIEASRSVTVLKELAASGKLYFKRRELTANFFAGAELFYEVENLESGSYQLRGKVRTAAQVFDISECELVFKGDPYWMVHRGSLRLFKGDVSWKWMRRVYEESPLKLTYDEAEDFFELADRAHIIGSYDSNRSQLPMPLLALTDNRGAFANLLMNYDGRCVPLEAPWEKTRNQEAEQQWKSDLLEAGYLEKQMGTSQFYCPVDKVAETLQFLLELGWEVRDSQGKSLVLLTDSAIAIASEREVIEVRGKVIFGGSEAAISEVVKAVRKEEPFIALNPGSVGLITKEMARKSFSGLVGGEICSDRIVIRKHNFTAIDGLCDSEAALTLDVNLKLLRDGLKGLDALPKMLPGACFRGELREYQQRGLAWLTFLNTHGLHGILADDMGLGKTVQVLAFLSTLELSKPVLIVMPKSLLFHWKIEIARFLPECEVIVHHGAERQQAGSQWDGNQAVLTSYATLRSDIELFREQHFACIILDEAQVIKNAASQTAKAARSLKGDFRLSVTGTPIENHIGELLSQFDFLIPGLFRGEDQLRSPLIIKKITRPFILRRKKEEVDEQLPEKIVQNVWLDMEGDQRKLYEEFLAGIRQGLLQKVREEGAGKHHIQIFEAILRLRQICCHPLLFNHDFGEIETSAKLEALLMDIETLVEEGKKALVFSQFTSMLKLIKKQIVEKGWEFVYLDGETKDREAVVERFQNDPQTQIFLISLKTGGVGMNLTAADYVFLFDPWWNEAVENQAIDRAHRIGRHHSVIAKRFLIRDTIEERMMQLKQYKQDLASDVMELDSASLDEDDVEFLLSQF